MLRLALYFAFIGFVAGDCKSPYPNIVFILADDMGWNDVSFHGSDQIQTPNIDMLAYTGVALKRYYSSAVCTPSRSSLLTGLYSHISGMQGYPLSMSEDRGLPTNITILPQYLKGAGYKTHLVGKWHVGASRDEFLPTERGFDSHFGHRGGYIDYYEYTLEEVFPSGLVAGMALYRNKTAAWDVEGYITDVYTDRAKSVIEEHNTCEPLFLLLAHNAPHAGDSRAALQAPPEVVRQMRHIEIPGRRIYAAMVKKLDDSVGEIVKALNDKDLLHNTIIVFASDNGGMTTGLYQNDASNYPMRGTKMSPFEGGVHVAGLVWRMAMNNTEHVYDGIMHVSDWVPTLLGAAGLKIPANIDGVNQWENINSNLKSNRKVFYEMDDYTGYASITRGNYKLITGTVPKATSTYQGDYLQGIIGTPPIYEETLMDSVVYDIMDSMDIYADISGVRNKMTIHCNGYRNITCMPDKDTVCMFNILEDPCETTDLSATYPRLVADLKCQLDAEMQRRVPRAPYVILDPLSAPSLHNFTWAPWIKS